MDLATECFFSFDIFEIHSDAFLGCKCVVGLLKIQGSTKFLIFVFIFLKYVILDAMSFFVFILDSIFCGTIFFHFLGQCVASLEILMSSLLLHSLILLT